MLTWQLLLEAAAITCALSVDAFVSGFAYGANKIKIPFVSAMIVNVVSGAVLAAALFAGSWIGTFIPRAVTLTVCAVLLIVLGLAKIADSCFKALAARRPELHKEIRFSLFSLKFILHIRAKPEAADADDSKTLRPAEAAALALAVSLDGLAAGLGAGLADTGVAFYWSVVGFSLITDIAFLYSGGYFGRRVAKLTRVNLAWLSGLILIGLAVWKLAV
ncbi:sporulation membrane protein YtaF [Clostridia bacterium]|nr:sporulation membrane protein YtaF [Clostridia bacterium]